MGKIERIVQTLEGVDDEDIISAKPTVVLREEIASKAAKIRNEADTGSEYESDEAKEKFRNEITQEYIGELNMNPRIINSIIDEYVEYL
jgi:hypothetical protein